MQCKSLWIEVSAKCINVNVNVFWPLDTACFKFLRSFMVPSGVLETHLYNFWTLSHQKSTFVLYIIEFIGETILKRSVIFLVPIDRQVLLYLWDPRMKDASSFAPSLISSTEDNPKTAPTLQHSFTPVPSYMLTTTAPYRQLTSNPLTGFFRVHTVISLCFINIRLSVGFSIDSAMFPSRVGLQKKEIKRMKAAQNFNGRLKSENLRSFLLKNWPYLLS